MIPLETSGGREVLKLKKLRKGASVLGLTALALVGVGCHATNRGDARPHLGPAERVDFDFGGSGYTGDWRRAYGSTCLAETAYDPKPNKGVGAIIAYDVPSDTITVHPNIPGPDLHFTGFHDASRPLQSADAATSAVIGSYGCPQTPDASIRDRNKIGQ